MGSAIEHDDSYATDPDLNRTRNVEVCYHIVSPAAHTFEYVKRKQVPLLKSQQIACLVCTAMLVPKFFKPKLFDQALPLNLTILPHG